MADNFVYGGFNAACYWASSIADKTTAGSNLPGILIEGAGRTYRGIPVYGNWKFADQSFSFNPTGPTLFFVSNDWRSSYLDSTYGNAWGYSYFYTGQVVLDVPGGTKTTVPNLTYYCAGLVTLGGMIPCANNFYVSRFTSFENETKYVSFNALAIENPSTHTATALECGIKAPTEKINVTMPTYYGRERTINFNYDKNIPSSTYMVTMYYWNIPSPLSYVVNNETTLFCVIEGATKVGNAWTLNLGKSATNMLSVGMFQGVQPTFLAWDGKASNQFLTISLNRQLLSEMYASKSNSFTLSLPAILDRIVEPLEVGQIIMFTTAVTEKLPYSCGASVCDFYQSTLEKNTVYWDNSYRTPVPYFAEATRADGSVDCYFILG